MSKSYKTLLAPSILGGDHANLRDSLKIIEDKELEWVHFDIMDGSFVPNLSFGPETVKSLRLSSKLFFDVHLMLEKPYRYVDAFIDSGADQITIHIEPDYPVLQTLAHIKSRTCRCGVVLNPDTPADKALEFLPVCDIILLMTVEPGFGGQDFRYDVLPKIEQFERWRQEYAYNYRIEVDGGIDSKTAPLCTKLGVDTLVAGTGFFQAKNQSAFIAAVTA